MPLKLQREKGGFKVINTDTKKEYSRNPIPLKRAEAQQRLLTAILSPKKKGMK
jgi:hypothetical protein